MPKGGGFDDLFNGGGWGQPQPPALGTSGPMQPAQAYPSTQAQQPFGQASSSPQPAQSLLTGLAQAQPAQAYQPPQPAQAYPSSQPDAGQKGGSSAQPPGGNTAQAAALGASPALNSTFALSGMRSGGQVDANGALGKPKFEVSTGDRHRLGPLKIKVYH